MKNMRLTKIMLLACSATSVLLNVSAKTYSLSGRQDEQNLVLKSGNTYVVSAEYIIPQGCILKIPEGVNLVFEQNVALSVEGTLNASGSMSHPVQFVGKQSRPEFWSGIFMKQDSNIDLYGCVVSDAKTGLKIGGNCHAIARSCSFVNNLEAVYFWDSAGTLDHCYVAKNSGTGLNIHHGPTIVSHCTIAENGGKGVFVWQWGHVRLTDSVVSRNLSHGFCCETSFGKCFATGCVFEKNREFDVKNDTDSIWDFRENYWGEESTKVLNEKGSSANLEKIEDKRDGHRDGIVDITGFLLKPPKDCGAAKYPGCKGRVKRPDACDQENKGEDEKVEEPDNEDTKVNDSASSISEDSQDADDAEAEKPDEKTDVHDDLEVNDEPLFIQSAKVPDDLAISRAVKVMNELCGEEVKSGKLTDTELAVKLMSYARKTDNVTVKFVLLRNAYRRLLMANAVRSAQELFDKTMFKFGTRFAVAMSKSGKALLESHLKKPKTAKDALRLQSEIDELMTSIDAINAADEALRKRPADIAARRKKAFNLLKIGEWQAVLELYAKMDGDRGTVAKWELSADDVRSSDWTPEKVGDYWWAVVEDAKESGALFKSVSRHAVYWYRLALRDGSMSEMKKELVKKRIARSGGSVIVRRTGSEAKRTAHCSDEKVVPMSKKNAESAKKANVETTADGLRCHKLIETAEGGGNEWAFVTKPPKTDWLKPNFNDMGWNRGMGVFSDGTITPRKIVETTGSKWNDHTIWLRKRFQYAGQSRRAIKKILFRYVARGYDSSKATLEIWINGKRISADVKVGGNENEGTDYQNVDITDAAKDALNIGNDNLIAIKCWDGLNRSWSYWTRFIDVGLMIYEQQ